MGISVTKLKQRCLELAREIEATGRRKPWERLRGRGRWLAAPGETQVTEKDPAEIHSDARVAKMLRRRRR